MVCCEGKNEQGEPRFCFCFNRQILGCKDEKMKVSKRPRDEIIEIIQDGLIW